MVKDRSPRRRPEPKPRKTGDTPAKRRWVLLLLAALPIIGVALLTYAALRSPWLTVQNVRVEGTQSLDPDSLVQISGLTGKSMFDLPLDNARDQLQQLPQVKSVSITRSWPHTLVMHVDEREPAAFWTVGGRDYVVDAEGIVLDAGAPSAPAPHIVEVNSNRIMGPGDRVQPDAIALAQRIFDESPKFLGQSVSSLEYSTDIGVTAVFGNGMRVTFGDDRSYDYKVSVLTTLLDQLSAQGYKPKAVDLRFGERVTYE